MNNLSHEEKVQHILTNYGLDFHIHKLPMMVNLDGTEITSEYYGLLNGKTNEIINTVKEGYRVSQNDEVIDLVLRGMEGYGDLSIKKAGAFDGGRKVYVQLGIEGQSILNDGDTVNRYVTIIDSNDGSTGLAVGIGDLTMSCQNQFFRFYKQSQTKFRHSASLEQKIKEIPDLIRIALNESLKQFQLYNNYQSTTVSRDLAHQMVNYLLGFDKKTTSVRELSEKNGRSLNMMENLYNNIEHQMNEKGNNLWGLHSGVTRWTTHERTAPKRDNGRLESLMVGSNYKTNIEALEFGLEYSGLVL